jgi:Na+-driven multidrug efflux pump
VKALASQLIFLTGMCQPLFGFVHATYFTLRAGGKSIVTFLFDSAFMWVCAIPVVFCLCHFTGLPVQMVYLCSLMTDLIKCCIGFVLVKKGVWIKKIVNE